MDALKLLKLADADIQGAKIKSAHVFASKLQAALDSECDHGFERGYFCAVAALLKAGFDQCAKHLFPMGGDWKFADPADIEVFREHGFLQNI